MTKKAMEELHEKIKKDPKLAGEFARDFEGGLASQGYFLTEEFRKKLAMEAESKMKNALKKIPASDKKLNKKIESGEEIKVKVKIDREKKTKDIKIK
ncbi:MAG: hypothetical protein PHD13_01355 [Methanocellales archaeon]|nr:hypothetical protein [Methanocellales archaeon]MDD3290925.1 hypothetical protein [Methanocellales archaeon]MDD3292331.1 hypothetical protein [Methanocellales archaeon]MDD5234810.1 hypothetical protein [Methanocellales archaeon]MDD5484820.1 hypothetical protein [Methanocellales archaeon]